MVKTPIIVWVIFAFAAFCQVATFVESAKAQKTASGARRQNTVGLGENEVRDLLTSREANWNGKISKVEFLKLMEAEFERLDVNKSGELDVQELTQSPGRASRDAGGE